MSGSRWLYNYSKVNNLEGHVAILGSTGSIGVQTLQVCRHLGLQVDALAARRNVTLLEQQARAFSPQMVAIAEDALYLDLKNRLADTSVRVEAGPDAVCNAAQLPQTQVVCNAVMGMVGLRPTLAAIQAGKQLALSNKETLVAAGRLVKAEAASHQVQILPVDSEHSAIFQCLQGNRREDLKKVLLTASGGPFRGKSRAELEGVTAKDALRHPNWAMGAKITVDSATLMNKGLEFIEAMWLFDLQPEQIEVIVHPQSVIHSAVEYRDGAVIAQLGIPDMAIPIQYALTWPSRKPIEIPALSLTDYGALTFERPDLDTFECLRHCIRAAELGGLYPCAINSANEQAVALFLEGKIRFFQIGEAVGEVLERFSCDPLATYTLEQVERTDKWAREAVLEYCGRG